MFQVGKIFRRLGIFSASRSAARLRQALSAAAALYGA
jgi:hypothetical protein